MTSNNELFFVLDSPIASFNFQNSDGEKDGYNWYAYVGNDPINYIEPDGLATEASIDYANKAITVETRLYIYGDGATSTIAQKYEDDIMDGWSKDRNGNDWKYTDDNGDTWTVEFDVSVDVSNNPLPGIIFDQSGNYINVPKDNEETSNVFMGRTGTWRDSGRNGRTLDQDNPAAHEYGHILGLNDRYMDNPSGTGSVPRPNTTTENYTKNVMALSATNSQAHADQYNIDAISSKILSRDQEDLNPNNGTTFYNTGSTVDAEETSLGGCDG